MDRKLKLIFFIAAVLIAAAPSSPAAAGTPVRKETSVKKEKKPFKLFRRKGKEAPKDTVKTKTAYEKLVDGASVSKDGAVNVKMKKGKVYLEIPDSLLGRTFAAATTVKSISDNAIAVVGAKSVEGLTFYTFTKADSTLYLRQVSFDYSARDTNVLKALAYSHTGAVLQSFPVKAKNARGASVIDASEWFLSNSEFFNVFKFYLSSGYAYKENYSKNLSYITDVKAFQDNFSVTVSRSYTYNASSPVTDKTVKKNVPFTVETTSSFFLLPEEIYHPRMADPRIGFFFTDRIRLGDFATDTKTVYFANRWRLEPSDTAAFRAGQKVEPVKPITYYIDNNFPSWWKPYIFDAVNQWNEVFEEIGFKNAVRALPFPEDDPDFDPDNIHYTCIRYAPVSIQNAMGPSWVDPRSGEILNASVWVYHDVIKLLSTWIFVQTSQADPDVRTADIPREILGDALMYVIKHEVGHTLGLMHNMSSSSTIPLESLRDPEFTGKYGTTNSIMDYARFNYVAQPGDKERGVKLTPPRFGRYDRYAIRWGYTPIFDVPFEQETEITTRWITDSTAASPIYKYGKQQMFSNYFDPRCQTEDLSDDVFGASTYGIANLKYIMANFLGWIDDASDPECRFRMDVYMGLVNQYLRYSGHILYNIGGLYKNEILPGEDAKRFENIPRERQLKAIDYLIDMYGDTDWMEDKAVLGKLPVAGSPVQAVKSSIFQNLMMTPFMAMASDGVDTCELSPSEIYSRIFDFVWKPTVSGRKLTDSERYLESQFVSLLMRSGGFAIPSGGSKQTLAGTGSDMPDNGPMGSISYNPVSGFEWYPFSNMNRTTLTPATIYVYLEKAYDLMKKRVGGASGKDKAHYKLLMSQIEYSVK